MERSVVFAGGGSGGHISPALAVAERLVEMKPDLRTVFLCSDRAVDRSMLADAGVAFEAIGAAPLSLRPAGLLRFARGFYGARRAARERIRAHAAGCVVATGGYIAAPVVAAAVAARAPVTLLNLDNPPGKSSRWIARRARRVLCAIEVTGGGLPESRVVGVPIRRRALAPGPAEACRRELGLDEAAPTLLVTGASQGARSINRFMQALAAADAALFRGWQVLHLCGEGDDADATRAYAAAGASAVVKPFVHAMGLAWGAADLAVSRAGASSVAEAWANAVPTLFLPYPFHRDRHQFRNAAAMTALGGALVEEDRVEPTANLAGAGATLRGLMRAEGRRAAMRSILRARPPPDAAATVARLVLEELGE
jgi:UDP-N-acetylglucosamine--N-acetylmuramyl-(pentapeptide) pyrophosphoryl-undecaprenol N-acetylglucosamine transferase